MEPPLQNPHVESKSEEEVEEEVEEEMRSQPSGLYLLQLVPDEGESQFQFPLTKSIPCLCTAPGYHTFTLCKVDLTYEDITCSLHQETYFTE